MGHSFSLVAQSLITHFFFFFFDIWESWSPLEARLEEAGCWNRSGSPLETGVAAPPGRRTDPSPVWERKEPAEPN